MGSSAQEALRRLQERVESRAAADWLGRARVECLRSGSYLLTVGTALQKRWLETRCAAQMREAFGGAVEVRAPAAAPAPLRPARVRPHLAGPSGEYAIGIVRAFVEGGSAAASLVVVHGPAHCGKSLLADWAVSLAPRRIFRLDVDRLRAGRSRGLVPRKPLVVADGVERLAGRVAAQRTLCAILDRHTDRGDRLLLTLEGHPAEAEGLYPALRNRLRGGVLVALHPPTAADMRAQLRDRARRHGMRLPRDWEDELAQLPPASALRALDVRMQPCSAAPRDRLERMTRIAAQLFGVDPALMQGGNRRRGVVAARRAVIAAARALAIEERTVAEAFGIRSLRTLRAACRWAERERQRDRGLAAILRELGRVLPAE